MSLPACIHGVHDPAPCPDCALLRGLSSADVAEMKRGRAFHSALCMERWMHPCCCDVGNPEAAPK